MRRFLFSVIVIVIVILAAANTYAASGPACEGRTGYCANLGAAAFAVGNRAAVSDVTIGTYIEKIYIYLLGLVGVSALLMFIVGGILYMTARDNAAQVGKAKDYLWNAVLGLVLALVSWLLLNTINPDLVKKLAIDLEELTPVVEPGGESFQATKDTLAALCRDTYAPEVEKYYGGYNEEGIKNCVDALANPQNTTIYDKTGKECTGALGQCDPGICETVNGKKVCMMRTLLQKVADQTEQEQAQKQKNEPSDKFFKEKVAPPTLPPNCLYKLGAPASATCPKDSIDAGAPFRDVLEQFR